MEKSWSFSAFPLDLDSRNSSCDKVSIQSLPSLALWQWEIWEAKGPYVLMIQTKMLCTSLHWRKSVILLWTSDFPPSSHSTWCGIGTLKSSAEGVQALYLTEACAINDSLSDLGDQVNLIGCLSWLLLFQRIQLDVGISASARVLLHRCSCSPGDIFFGTKKKLGPNVLPGHRPHVAWWLGPRHINHLKIFERWQRMDWRCMGAAKASFQLKKIRLDTWFLKLWERCLISKQLIDAIQ